MGRLRLLAVVHYPVFGGPHNQLLRLAPLMSKLGIETIALLPDEPGNAAARLRAAGMEVVTAPLHRLRATPNPRTQIDFLASIRPEVEFIRGLIEERDIDLVQICGLVHPQAAVAARSVDVPVVWQVLDTRAPRVVRRAMLPLLRRYADVVMPIGRSIIADHPGLDELSERIAIFYPPIDTEVFAPIDRPRRRRDDRIVVGTVGNLNPQKGHEYFLRAASLITSEARYVITGAAYQTHRSYYKRLVTEAVASGQLLGEDVVFMGERTDIEHVIKSYDIFAMSSVPRSEGVPNAIVEAMSAGLPVVATDVGGIRDVVDHGVTGLLVKPCDPLALASAIQMLVDNPEVRERMGAAGRQRVIDTFSIQHCLTAHIQAFEKALSRKGRTPMRLIDDDDDEPVKASELEVLAS